MALAIVKEDGTGLATANAYQELAEAQAVVDDWGVTAALTIASLIEATAEVEANVRVRADTYPKTATQALIYPAIYTDAQLRTSDDYEIPAGHVTAIALHAADLVRSTPASLLGDISIRELKAGLVNVELGTPSRSAGMSPRVSTVLSKTLPPYVRTALG